MLLDASIAGSMATMSGVFFVLGWLLAPERGLVARRAGGARQRLEFAQTMLAIHLANHEGRPEAEVESRVEHLHGHLRWDAAFAERSSAARSVAAWSWSAGSLELRRGPHLAAERFALKLCDGAGRARPPPPFGRVVFRHVRGLSPDVSFGPSDVAIATLPPGAGSGQRCDASDRRLRRANPATIPPAAARPRAATFVVAQVRQALQQTAAIGACSPYFPAAWASRPCSTTFMRAVYARSADRSRARSAGSAKPSRSRTSGYAAIRAIAAASGTSRSLPRTVSATAPPAAVATRRH